MLMGNSMRLQPHPSVIQPPSQEQVAQISLPHLYTPRDYQRDHLLRPLFPHLYPDLKALSVERKKRIACVWHRRAGKDKTVVNALAIAAYEELGNYLYLLPEQTQAKKIVWRGIGGDGVKFIDHIPSEIIKRKYESEMLVELTNGSTIQIGGSDNYDSWMGTNPRGIILSEYSLQDPMAWQYFRPILTENGGWAVFIYTARGKNHGYELYNVAKNNPETWHCSLLTINDTKRPDGSPVVSLEQYKQEIAEGMPEAMAKQEFYCDFDAALFGSYYGELMSKAREEKRIGFHPYDPEKPVHTAWDMGNDANVVWFIQQDGSGFRAIDYYEEPNVKFSDVCKEVVAKPYAYGVHLGPHDSANRDPEHNTRINTAREHGIDIERLPRMSRDDGIEAVRNLLPKMKFNEETCERGIDALCSYERMFDNKLQVFREQPCHNWASHGADALRMFAMGWNEALGDSSWFDKPLDIDASQYI